MRDFPHVFVLNAPQARCDTVLFPQVQCPHLVIKATQGPRYMSEEVYSRIHGVFRRYNPNFVYREVQGGHHLHLNTPHTLAPVINTFLDKKFDTSETQEGEHKPQFDL